MRKAFTLLEMVVALGILALILSFAGVIFRVSIESQRLALANAEIMQKYRTITTQLDEDLRGLCRDGEIFIIWAADRKPFSDPSRHDAAVFDRFDRIMFFTSGDFQTYDPSNTRGNVARVSYTLARGPSLDPADVNTPPLQKPERRMLARTQHILVPPVGNAPTLNTRGFTDAQWRQWNCETEVDRISLAEWKQIPGTEKMEMLSIIGEVIIGDDPNNTTTTSEAAKGVLINRADPDSLHLLLCEGVGQFAVQGWNDKRGRWMPEIDPNGDGNLNDSDFIVDNGDLDPNSCPGVWYPHGGLIMGGITAQDLAQETPVFDEDHFAVIPGLGRALKFTFTLYDRRGLIKQGRTFTHIVYLDI
jgi:prepilin-type N-terminal cleavage/methylation domain-containing protein